MARVLLSILLLSGVLGASTTHAEPLVRLSTNFGDIIINLTPDQAPLTVENFLSYVNSDAFDESLFHRSVPGFVLQGGEAVWPEGAAIYSAIPENPAVVNEFNVSNTRGTVAMAKLADLPDSATNNFFINLADNSANLDNQNGGFTVFGTIDAAGMAIVDTIAALRTVSAAGLSDSVPITNTSDTLIRSNAVIIETAELVDGITPPATAILPASRSVSTGATATGFATMINTSSTEAASCTMQPSTSVAADFFYRRTNPANNQPFGINNPALDIPVGGLVSLLFTFTPTASFANTTIEFDFSCGNASGSSALVTGVNTFDLAASDTPIADVVALGGTTTADGINNIAQSVGSGAFVVATFNLGAEETITVSADTGDATLPIGLFVCPTVAETGDCQAGQSPAPSTTVTLGNNETGTFAVFAQLINSFDEISFDPANNRAFVRFRNAAGELRGSTSVALRTVP